MITEGGVINEYLYYIFYWIRIPQYVIDLLAVHQLSLLLQRSRGHFSEVEACALWEIGDWYQIDFICIRDKGKDGSIPWTWNCCDLNDIVAIHEHHILPFVLLLWSKCVKIVVDGLGTTNGVSC